MPGGADDEQHERRKTHGAKGDAHRIRGVRTPSAGRFSRSPRGARHAVRRVGLAVQRIATEPRPGHAASCGWRVRRVPRSKGGTLGTIGRGKPMHPTVPEHGVRGAHGRFGAAGSFGSRRGGLGVGLAWLRSLFGHTRSGPRGGLVSSGLRRHDGQRCILSPRPAIWRGRRPRLAARIYTGLRRSTPACAAVTARVRRFCDAAAGGFFAAGGASRRAA
jgi:hypothetical protein